MSTKVEERHRKLAREWLSQWFAGKTLDYYADGIAPKVAENERQVRLEEAQSLRPYPCQQEAHYPLRSPVCRACQTMARWEERIAALQPHEAEGGK